MHIRVLHIRMGTRQYREVGSWDDVESQTVHEALDRTWEITQNDNYESGEPWIRYQMLPVRSSMVGDIFVVDGVWYAVEPVGFVPVEDGVRGVLELVS